MKEMLLGMLKRLDWRKLGYELWVTVLRPEIEILVLKTESKWDDVGLQAADTLVDKLLKPEAVPAVPAP